MPGPLRAVLCDLDDTIFDHRRATRESLRQTVAGLPDFSHWSLDEIDARHRDLLEALHLDVLAGRMSVDEARLERFRRLVEAAAPKQGAARAQELARAYRQAYEQSWHPVAGAMDLLVLIKAAHLAVVIVTNNIAQEQEVKLRRLGLDALVDELVTSEEVGWSKPAAEIFRAALSRARCAVDQAVMLGDAWHTDVEGARAIGLRAVWLNRTGAVSPDPTVPELRSLEPARDALAVILHSR